MKECAKLYLEKRGYVVNSEALDIIKMCDDWYANRIVEDFHKRENLNGAEVQLNRMNFAKRCCADDAGRRCKAGAEYSGGRGSRRRSKGRRNQCGFH